MTERQVAAAPELTVIIVSYNTRDLTLNCIRTLYECTRETRFRCVLLDNDSQDGSADAVAEAFPQVELIRSADNLGFARANNAVAARAETEWLLLLNPDTEVHEGAVDRLLVFSRAHPEAGITGGRTVFPDGTLNSYSCWMRITPWSAFCQATGLSTVFRRSEIFNSEGIGGWKRDSVRHVDIVQGCFLMIRRALWNDLGGFNLKYFMYGEEADLCLRAGRLGYRPMITPEAEIMHLAGASATTRASKAIQVARARFTLMHDHWPAGLVPFGRACMWLWGVLRMLVWQGMALLRRRESDREVAARWRAIWAARGEWLDAYHEAG